MPATEAIAPIATPIAAPDAPIYNAKPTNPDKHNTLTKEKNIDTYVTRTRFLYGAQNEMYNVG